MLNIRIFLMYFIESILAYSNSKVELSALRNARWDHMEARLVMVFSIQMV